MILETKAIFLFAISLRYKEAKIPRGAAKIRAPKVEKNEASKRFKIPKFSFCGAHSLEKTKLKRPILKMAGSPKIEI